MFIGVLWSGGKWKGKTEVEAQVGFVIDKCEVLGVYFLMVMLSGAKGGYCIDFCVGGEGFKRLDELL